MSPNAVTVRCTSRICRWRGRRAPFLDCDCEWSCHCRWGRCPRCDSPVYTVAFLRDVAEQQRRTDEWLKTPEAKALLEKFGG